MAFLLSVFLVIICVTYSSTNASDPSDPCSAPDCIDDVDQFFVDPQRCPHYVGEVHPSLLNFEYCVYIIPLGSSTPEFQIPRPTDNFTDIFLQIIRPNCERQLPVGFSYYPLPNSWSSYYVPGDVIYRCCPKTGCSCGRKELNCTAEELKHDMIFDFIEHIETGNSSRTCFNRDHDPVPTYPGVDTCILAMSLTTQTSEGLSRVVNGPMSFNGFAGYKDSISTAYYQLRQEGCASWTAENGTVAEGYLQDGHCLQVLRPSAYEVLCCCYKNTEACKFYGSQVVPRKTDEWIRSLPPRQSLARRPLEGTKVLIDGRVKFHCVRATFKGKDFFLDQRAPRGEILADVADACLLKMTVQNNGTNGTHGFYMQLKDADIHNDCGNLDTTTGTYNVRFPQPTCRTKLVGNDKENLVMTRCCASGDFCNHPFFAFPSLSETLNFASPLTCDPSDQLEFAARQVTFKGFISSVKVCHVPWDIEMRRLSTEFYQYAFGNYAVMWELKVEAFNVTCRWYLASSWSGCYRDNTTEVLLPRLLFTCDIPVAEYRDVMSNLDVNAAYEQVKLQYGCSTTNGTFIDFTSYIARCSNNRCIESMGHSAGCYAIIQRTNAGVLQIQAGSVVNRTDVAKLYPKDVDESGKREKRFSQFRKFTELTSSSVVLICAMSNMPACNHYYHRMLYVYNAHAHVTGYRAIGNLVQTCAGTSDEQTCLKEDDCFLDVDLGDKTNQEGQCYRRSGWTHSINQSSTICDSFNSSDHCYALQQETGGMHLLCCCVDQCSNDIVGQSTAYGFRLG